MYPVIFWFGSMYSFANLLDQSRLCLYNRFQHTIVVWPHAAMAGNGLVQPPQALSSRNDSKFTFQNRSGQQYLLMDPRLCYNWKMDANCQIWRVWAENLHRWGLRDLTASFLEVAGPLTMIGAQLVYIGQPLFRRSSGAAHVEALANVLENPQERLAFIRFLRGEIQ